MEGMDFKRAEAILADALAETPGQLTDERKVELAAAAAFLIVSVPRSLASIAADMAGLRKAADRAITDDEPEPRQGMD